jgi:Lysine methyltransferase
MLILPKTEVAWLLPLIALGVSVIAPCLGLQNPKPTSTQSVQGLPVHRVLLRQSGTASVDDSSSPYCFAVSSMSDLPPSSNFLATQVWPSARVAARALETYGLSLVNKQLTICELGCGPGLPSVTAASTLQCEVIATDIDDLALHLVAAAAAEQDIGDLVTTRKYDLIQAEWEAEWMDAVDLFVMSDVFESQDIAKGAARLTQRIMSDSQNSTLWVFAQSDRAQREVYLNELRGLLPSNLGVLNGWSAFDSYNPNERLWICDLDETKVNYG